MTGKTETRMREIHRRTQRYRRRHENRVLSSLAAFSLFLLVGIGLLLRSVQARGISAVAEGYSSVLLREGAGEYIVVGIAAFAVGVAVTVICIRCKKKKSIRMEDAEDKEEKSI